MTRSIRFGCKHLSAQALGLYGQLVARTEGSRRLPTSPWSPKLHGQAQAPRLSTWHLRWDASQPYRHSGLASQALHFHTHLHCITVRLDKAPSLHRHTPLQTGLVRTARVLCWHSRYQHSLLDIAGATDFTACLCSCCFETVKEVCVHGTSGIAAGRRDCAQADDQAGVLKSPKTPGHQAIYSAARPFGDPHHVTGRHLRSGTPSSRVRDSAGAPSGVQGGLDLHPSPAHYDRIMPPPRT